MRYVNLVATQKAASGATCCPRAPCCQISSAVPKPQKESGVENVVIVVENGADDTVPQPEQFGMGPRDSSVRWAAEASWQGLNTPLRRRSGCTSIRVKQAKQGPVVFRTAQSRNGQHPRELLVFVRLHTLAELNDRITATMMGAWLMALCLTPVAIAADSPVSYFQDVRPILQRQCQGCHQPNLTSGGLDLTTFEGLAKGGSRGAAFQAGVPAESLVLKYVKGEAQPRMPLGATPLTPEEIDSISGWIVAGAKDDTPPAARDSITLDRPPVYHQPPVINALAFSPDGKTLAVSGYREVLLHSVEGGGTVVRLVGLSEQLNGIVFSKDGASLIAAGGTPARFGEVQVWDVRNIQLKRSITVTTDTLFGLSLSPDGKEFAIGAADSSVRLIETETGKELKKIGNHENWVLGTAFGVDGKRVVSVGRDRAAKLSDTASGAFLENINILRGELAAVARNPKKDVIVIGGDERIPYIYLMDRPKVMKTADDSTLIRKLPRQNGAISTLAWSPDGSKIGIGGMASEVNIYNPDSGELVASCKVAPGIYAVTFTPDGSRLATGGFDGHVRICNSATGELIRDFVPVPLAGASAVSAAGDRTAP